MNIYISLSLYVYIYIYMYVYIYIYIIHLYIYMHVILLLHICPWTGPRPQLNINFIYIGTDKYGWRPPPERLEATVFEKLHGVGGYLNPKP